MKPDVIQFFEHDAAKFTDSKTAIGTELSDTELARACKVAANVPDPELPFLTLEDLGILRSVKSHGSTVVAEVSPTYSGCPAVEVIEASVLDALQHAGFNARIERALAPAWSTDWITERGLEKLKANGIAPPVKAADKSALFSTVSVPCPRCDSTNTQRLSEFGSTPCKAQYRCTDCLEPFDHFKCH